MTLQGLPCPGKPVIVEWGIAYLAWLPEVCPVLKGQLSNRATGFLTWQSLRRLSMEDGNTDPLVLQALGMPVVREGVWASHRRGEYRIPGLDPMAWLVLGMPVMEEGSQLTWTAL